MQLGNPYAVRVNNTCIPSVNDKIKSSNVLKFKLKRIALKITFTVVIHHSFIALRTFYSDDCCD